MSDITELCRAMRGVNNVVDQRAAADAIESQAREIEELTERVTTLGAAVIAPVDGESVLGKLGSKLADLLDENDWASVEPYLNRALLENYGLRAQAEAAERELDEERLKALSSEGQWIEHSEKLAAERDAALRKVEELRGLLREVVEVVAACHNCLSYEAPELADRVDAALGEKP